MFGRRNLNDKNNEYMFNNTIFKNKIYNIQVHTYS